MEDKLTELTQWYRDRIDKLANGEKVDFNLHPGAISWLLGEAEKAEELESKLESIENLVKESCSRYGGNEFLRKVLNITGEALEESRDE
ncbi:hypothetical protein [Oceanobacillus kimchii]|uniref:hypothetical protein n=1 Tax=Oceanobacillus kimchii TaxID=746691 RepID=UPI000345BB4F|nr:hypothetical protein [Oceanobacillus kimchii]